MILPRKPSTNGGVSERQKDFLYSHFFSFLVVLYRTIIGPCPCPCPLSFSPLFPSVFFFLVDDLWPMAICLCYDGRWFIKRPKHHGIMRFSDDVIRFLARRIGREIQSRPAPLRGGREVGGFCFPPCFIYHPSRRSSSSSCHQIRSTPR
jgi:hypothetical protein